jgi:hypothetical protein
MAIKHHYLSLQDLPKFAQIGILDLKIYHLATLVGFASFSSHCGLGEMQLPFCDFEQGCHIFLRIKNTKMAIIYL